MIRIVFAATCLLLAKENFAQKTVDVTKGDTRPGTNAFIVVSGSPFINEKYVSLVEGSPYFREEWMKGVLIGQNGQEYKDLSLKLDLFDDKIHYKDAKGVELVATTPIKEVVLTDAMGNSYKFIHGSSLPPDDLKQTWLLLLSQGSVPLYKYFDKRISEYRPYNSATTEQRIKTTEKYCVVDKGTVKEIKKLKDVPSVLSDKKTELEDFLKNKDDKNARMDDRFRALIAYYNQLVNGQS
jgi:hypothetical protein